LHSINCFANSTYSPATTVRIYNSSTSGLTLREGERYTLVLSVVWFKIEDDGTNLKFYIGLPGSTMRWLRIAQFSRTTYMTGGPDQVFFGVSIGNNPNGFSARLVHWSRE
jgi:hypothetical protein